MGETTDRLGQLTTSTSAAISGGGGDETPHGHIDQTAVDRLIADWPQVSRTAARKTIERYGPPNEASPTHLTWHHNGVWKRTTAYREEIPHSFPKPHVDVLEQTIDYRVPPDKFDDLAEYDGSVVAARTSGELAARCDMEEMNVLALNLADEIAREQKTVDEARRTYAETAAAFMVGKSSPYVEGLRFDVTGRDTADRDQPAMGGVMKGIAEGVTGGRSS